MIPYGDGKHIHIPHESGVLVSGIEYDFVGYPQAHYCANDYNCASYETLGHPQRLNSRHSYDGEICHACKARELKRKLDRITVAGDLFERKMRRDGLGL